MSERSYHCLACRDGGIVVIFNPHFVREFRETWEQIEAAKSEVGRYDRVQRFWRRHPRWPDLGAISHSALCNCSCRQTMTLAAELDKYRRGERKDKQGINRPPGCSDAKWSPDISPLWPGPVDGEIGRVLSEFYASYLF